jgi:C4-dicarboxylate-specific signal transduction histidine kinase
MKRITSVIITILALAGCSAEHGDQARLINGTNPPLRYNPRTHTAKPKQTQEQIKLIRAQAEAKARLAQIESQKAAKLKEIEARKATEIARLESQKAQKVKELELKQTLDTNKANTKMVSTRAQSDIDIEKAKQANLLAKQKQDLLFYRQLTVVIVVFLLLLMVFLYLLYHRRHHLKLKLHEEELRHQAYLHESKQHHERVTKMLEIIAHENTDKNLKKELTKLLKEQGEKPALLHR